uniref:Uncharacterized protein n=1 Tax=Anguilla anguilla TaxID=7936 RepID=A0A0E9S3S5_ANGAN
MPTGKRNFNELYKFMSLL